MANNREPNIKALNEIAHKIDNKYWNGYLAREKPEVIDEMVGAGALAWLENASKYDPSRGISFLTYIKVIVRWRMLDEMRTQMQNPELPRGIREDRKAIDAAIQSLMAESDRKPDAQTLAAHLDWDQDRVVDALADPKGPGQNHADEAETDVFIDAPLSQGLRYQTPERSAVELELLRLFEHCLEKLIAQTPGLAVVLRNRSKELIWFALDAPAKASGALGSGLEFEKKVAGLESKGGKKQTPTLEEMADYLGVSIEQVRILEKKAKQAMRDCLKGLGIETAESHQGKA